jgi:hypothetical protein
MAYTADFREFIHLVLRQKRKHEIKSISFDYASRNLLFVY